MSRQGLLWLFVWAVAVSICVADEAPIDWQRAQQLHRKEVRGEKLTAEEQTYLERAKKAHGTQRGKGAKSRSPSGKPAHFVPLTELGTNIYNGQTGGLYGNGRNDPPEAIESAAKNETSMIRPLDKDGKPSESGKVVLLSLGMSNSTQEFSRFKQLLNKESDLSPNLIVVDGAQGGQDARITSQESARFWTIVDERLKQGGVSPKQVQAVWLKQAVAGGSDVAQLKGYLAKIVAIAKKRYPNLRVIYFSSRIYAGYASTGLNPEPYAYESAFAVRDLILDQAKTGRSEPVLLWGPYLWADGQNPRKSDGLVWKPEDLRDDGTHPSESGREKVAQQLLKFFKTDPNARKWFLRAS